MRKRKKANIQSKTDKNTNSRTIQDQTLIKIHFKNSFLKVNLHNIHLIKRSRTARAFPHTVADTIIHALITEEMAAGFECGVLEIGAAYRAQGHGLVSLNVRIKEFTHKNKS